MSFVLVSKDAHGTWTDYYLGKTYVHQGEPWVATGRQKDAKHYGSRKRALNAAEALGNKVGHIYKVEEIEDGRDTGVNG